MRRLLKRWKLLAGLALVAVLTAIALQPRSIAVEVAPVTRGSIQVTIDEEGETRVRQRYVISAPVTGQVLRIQLEPGDRVTKGQTVAVVQPGLAAPLDARERAEAIARVQAAEAAIGRARAELQRAQAAAEFAAIELRRARELYDANLIARHELDARTSQAAIAEQERAAAEFALRTAEQELRLARARLVPSGTGGGKPVLVPSPIDGVVLRRVRESEAVVASGEPLLELGDPDDLEIVSDLLSTDAVRVRPGHQVLIEQWGGDHTLEGRVRLVEPSGFTKISALGVEEQRVNVVIDFSPQGSDGTRLLGDGYRVEVRIVIAQKDDVLKVPTSSLFRHGDGFAVFVVDADRARLQPVEIGLRSGLEAEIVSGLAEGDRVVVHPPDTLTDGARVEVR